VRSRRLVTLATLLVLAVLLGTAWWSHRHRIEAERDLAATTARTVSLRQQLTTAAADIVAADKKRASLAAAPEPVKPPPPPATPPKPRPPGLIDLSRKDPNLWNLFIASQNAGTAKRYGPLFQKLGLTADQIDRFKAISAASGARYADIAAAGDAQGLKYEDPAMVKLRKEAEQQGIAEQTALLGEAGYRELAEYNRTLGARGLAHGLAAAVAFTDPLSAIQAEQLTQAITQSSPAGKKGEFFSNLSDLDWTEADRRAQTILTPAQYAVWLRGDSHDVSIGSRLSLQLQASYEQARKEDLAKAGAGKEPGK
jgi:hypothetical protein